jgi:hypothetical protein
MVALDQLHELASAVPASNWPRRRDPARWSVAECVAHLNLTSAAYLPLLSAALDEARALGDGAPGRYRRDPVGWLLWRMMGPPVRIRTRTIAAFVPEGGADRDQLVARFERLQEAQVAALHAADNLPLGRVRVTSPFNPRVRYNLFSCFSILTRHQHRHLWQAGRVWPTRTG